MRSIETNTNSGKKYISQEKCSNEATRGMQKEWAEPKKKNKMEGKDR